MRYGTYTTIDTPTKQQAEALEFLRRSFDKIGGNVYQLNNSHDFGSYPSFEVNYPDEIEADEDSLELDAWHDEANKITARYYKKFRQYL